MKISKKIILILFLSCLLTSTNAYAVIKLDFVSPAIETMDKVKKEARKVEEKYTATIQKMNEKVRKALGAEGAALFQVVANQGKYIIKQAIRGQLSMSDLSLGNMLGAVKSQFGNYKLDLANLMALNDDYMRAVKNERKAKEVSMNNMLATLLAKRTALNAALAKSSGQEQADKIKELQEAGDAMYTELVNAKAKIKAYNKQIKKAQESNQKMQGFIDTRKAAAGENWSEEDEKEIKMYEDAIAHNESKIAEIKRAIAHYNSVADHLKTVQDARDSLKTSVAGTPTEALLEELDKTDKEIASLKAQIVKNAAAQQNHDRFRGKMDAISSQINDMAAKISADALVGKLSSQADDFFNKLGSSKPSNDEMFGEGVGAYFLGESEVSSPKSIARVVKERKKEFYNSYKNVVEAVINGYKTTASASEESEGCLNASTQMADGVFGAMSMRVCNDIQSAKAAIQYTELLLAQLRFDAAASLQGWTDRYKMADYDHDISELDLDAYVMGKKNSVKSLLKKAKEKANDALKSESTRDSALSGLESQLNKLW